ncbi:MAG: L,D-transpeptidase, partial [Deltaproteobacteria bacterium]|nr:L,D-transpeptidase [Deltaproteobacteria bacterium]
MRRLALGLLTLVVGAIGCSEPDPSAASTAPGSAKGSLDTTRADGSASPAASAELPEPVASDAPVVDLAGIANLPGALPADRPRIGATRWVVRIRQRPHGEAKVIGFLRGGAVVEAAGPAPVGGKGCKAGWRQLKPAGYVCMDDVTVDLSHPIVQAAARRPDFAQRLPYMYGTVTRGGPVYARLPTDKHLKKFEPNLKKHLAKWRKDKVSGARYGLDVWLRYTSGRAVPTALEALEARVTDRDIPDFLLGGKTVPRLAEVVAGDAPIKVDQVDRRQGRSFI